MISRAALRLAVALGLVASVATFACDLQPQPLPPADENTVNSPSPSDDRGNSSEDGEGSEPTGPGSVVHDAGDAGDSGDSDGGDASCGDAG